MPRPGARALRSRSPRETVLAWRDDGLGVLQASLSPVVVPLLICRFRWCIADDGQPFALFLPDKLVKRSRIRTAEGSVHCTGGSVHGRVGHDVIHVICPDGTMGIDPRTNP